MKVYLDNAATTALNKDVLNKMLPYFTDVFGNASSIHTYGREASSAVNSARETVANIINAKPNEIYFTSGGSESDNWAIKGTFASLKSKGNHIITSVVEHPAVLETLEQLKKEGAQVTYLPVDKGGRISLIDLENAITDKTILITIMSANNEVGTIQPIEEIGAIAKRHNILFHTDAVQAMGTLEIDVVKMNIDMLSMSAHKFHGPKGIGVLYVKNGVRPQRLIAGGHQERKMRAGTTNTPGIIGLAEALKISAQNREENNKKILALRNYFIDRVLSEIPYSYLNGDRENRLVGNANLSFEFIEGESILFNLDLEGIAVSSGSACAAGSLEPSYVLLSLGIKEELAHSSIRFTIGNDNTKEEIDYTIEKLKKTVSFLRTLSPLFKPQGEEHYV